MLKRWTVTELTRYVRGIFEMDFHLQDLEVEGEISDFRIPGSGHAYFTLKDAEAQLRCVMWRSDVQAQTYRPQQGDHVVVRGQMGVYEAGGQYQLYCRSLHPVGVGDLHARFEELKAQLQAEGLFESSRKRPTPELPRGIGIVTSPSAAALQDVLHILRRRLPLTQVVISPTAVQGDQAPPQIVSALMALNARADIDVILVVRGGGSLEDLWCFNDEQVVRAVAASRTPVISGVGHEIDFTLTDFAADVRAPTPSVAAELATPITVDDLKAKVHALRGRLTEALTVELDRRARAVEQLIYTLRRLSPQMWLAGARQTLDMLLIRAYQAASQQIVLKRSHLDGIRRTLQAFNPQDTLARGYAIVQRADGRVLRSAAETQIGHPLSIRLHRGHLQAIVNQQDVEDE